MVAAGRPGRTAKATQSAQNRTPFNDAEKLFMGVKCMRAGPCGALTH